MQNKIIIFLLFIMLVLIGFMYIDLSSKNEANKMSIQTFEITLETLSTKAHKDRLYTLNVINDRLDDIYVKLEHVCDIHDTFQTTPELFETYTAFWKGEIDNIKKKLAEIEKTCKTRSIIKKETDVKIVEVEKETIIKEMNKLWPGDIFLTRNLGITEEQNESPGYFNHAAIYVGDNAVVEAQVGYGVIKVTLDSFLKRYPIIIRLKPEDEIVGLNAAAFAKTLIGQPYRKIASVFYWLRLGKGYNCLSLVRQSYSYALGFDPGWKIPDHLRQDKYFKEIQEKFDNNFSGDGKIRIEDIL